MNDTPTGLAEQATIGALMLDSSEIVPVSRWLRRRDFDDPWLGDVYALLRERAIAGEPCDLQAVGVAHAARVAPHLVDLPRLFDTVHLTPSPPQPHLYARAVVEGGLRRDFEGLGVVLTAGALAAADQLHPRPLERTVAQLDGLVNDAEQRWQLAHRATGGGSAAAAPVAAQRSGPDLVSGANRYLRARSLPTRAGSASHERLLAGSLVTRTGWAARVADAVPPDWFVDRRWAAVYAAVLDLTAAGEPVDVVTVAWRVHQTSPRFRAAPSATELLSAVEDGLLLGPSRLAARVSADVTVRTAAAAEQSLCKAAENPGLAMVDLFDTARTMLSATMAAAAGLRLPHGGGDTTMQAAPHVALTVGGTG